MPEYTSTLVDAGIDWITCSAQTEDRRARLVELGNHHVTTEQARGDKVLRWGAHGLAGWRTRHAVCIWSDKMAVVELHEHLSHDHWRDVKAIAENVSRFDLQATVRQEPFDPLLAIDTWHGDQARAHTEGKPPVYDLYARKGQGDTLYIGSGRSDFKARLYNKWRQSRMPEYAGCWRYEVQARRERANQAANLLAGDQDDASRTSRIVHGHFDQRGVTPIYAVDRPMHLAPLPPSPSDAARSLAWIESSWRSTLDRLQAWGAEDDAWRVLGFRFDPRTGAKITIGLED